MSSKLPVIACVWTSSIIRCHLDPDNDAFRKRLRRSVGWPETDSNQSFDKADRGGGGFAMPAILVETGRRARRAALSRGDVIVTRGKQQ
jgi:hypothetical protein